MVKMAGLALLDNLPQPRGQVFDLLPDRIQPAPHAHVVVGDVERRHDGHAVEAANPSLAANPPHALVQVASGGGQIV